MRPWLGLRGGTSLFDLVRLNSFSGDRLADRCVGVDCSVRCSPFCSF